MLSGESVTTSGAGEGEVAPPKAGAERHSLDEAEVLERVFGTARILGLHIEHAEHSPVNGARPDVVLTANGRKLWVTVSTKKLKAWEVSAARLLGGIVSETDPAFVGNLVLAPSTPARAHEGVEVGQTWFVSLPLEQDDGLTRLQTSLLDALPTGQA
jgi:hypothetical protein